jgi:hypothetical protein
VWAFQQICGEDESLRWGSNLFVVELGCGYYSTPTLNGMICPTLMEHLVFYKDKDWAAKIIPLANQGFTVWEKVENWPQVKCPPGTALAFIDREVETTNKERAIHLHDASFQRAGIVVYHDWETIRDDKGRHHFKYFKLFDDLKPTTAVFSNFIKL